MKKNLGFTMLELMTVVAIISILIALAIPNLNQWVSERGVKNAASDLYGNFYRAKSEAIMRNTRVTVTFDQLLSPPVVTQAEVFFYVIYVDNDNDMERDVGEAVLAMSSWRSYSGVSLDLANKGGNNFRINNQGLSSVSFLPNGLTVNLVGAFGSGTVSLKNDNNQKRAVTINSTGYISVEKY
ncbi:MAG: GspH/FimT family protein [Desulfobacterales bacterium]|nr:GspH/FimT family protein [Desulfobacterales bacterium]